MIPFNGSYTRQQWGRGIRLAMYPRGRGLILRLAALALMFVGVAVIVMSLLQENANVSRVVRVAISLIFLGAWIALPYFRAWRAAVRPWHTPGHNPSLKGVVTGEGIISNASASGAIEKWDSFLRAHVRNDLVVLLGTDGLATILPRDFFANEDQWQSFRQMVEFNVVTPS